MVRSFIQGAILLLLVTGCRSGSMTALAPDAASETVHLVRFGWHADIVLPTEACKPLPDEAPEWLASAHRIAVGWGDARYFPHESPGLATALRAALVPTASVLQVRAVNVPVERLYRAYEVLSMQLSEAECRKLGNFIRSSFAVVDSALVRVPTDRETSAVYYLSTDRYHLLHNCNHWVAEALRAAGFPLRPALTPTVGLLWRAAERIER